MLNGGKPEQIFAERLAETIRDAHDVLDVGTSQRFAKELRRYEQWFAGKRYVAAGYEPSQTYWAYDATASTKTSSSSASTAIRYRRHACNWACRATSAIFRDDPSPSAGLHARECRLNAPRLLLVSHGSERHAAAATRWARCGGLSAARQAPVSCICSRQVRVTTHGFVRNIPSLFCRAPQLVAQWPRLCAVVRWVGRPCGLPLEHVYKEPIFRLPRRLPAGMDYGRGRWSLRSARTVGLTCYLPEAAKQTRARHILSSGCGAAMVVRRSRVARRPSRLRRKAFSRALRKTTGSRFWFRRPRQGMRTVQSVLRSAARIDITGSQSGHRSIASSALMHPDTALQ